MGNKHAREYQKRNEIKEAWQTARTVPRPFNEDICIQGIGVRRLLLVRLPSFNEGMSWDVRELDNEWQLFRSHVDSETGLATGYTKLDIDSGVLAKSFDRIVSLNLEIAPDFSGMVGADGERYQLTIFGDLSSSIRFEWWSDFPENWKPLVDAAIACLQQFRVASAVDSGT